MPPAQSSANANPTSLRSAWLHQVQATPWLSAGLALSLLAVLGLLVASAWNAVHGDNKDNLHMALLGGLAGFGATALGAVLAVVLRDVSARSQDVMLGFAAGMMLAASSFSLILPGLEAAREITGNGPFAALTVVVGMGLGGAADAGPGPLHAPMSTKAPAPAAHSRNASTGCGCSCWRSPCTTCPRAWPSAWALPTATSTWACR